MNRFLPRWWLALAAVFAGAEAQPVIEGRVGTRAREPHPVYFLKTGESITLTAVEAGHAHAVRWQRYDPILRAYDNRPERQQPPVRIRYRATPLSPRPLASLTLSFDSPGTRLVGLATPASGLLSDSAPLHRAHAGRIVQIVVRSGDRYCDYLQELVGTPFIMGPGVVRGGWHQTDQRVGSDCASFATYGQRRLGKTIPYAGPVGILDYLRPLRPAPLAPPAADGLYRDDRGRPVSIGRGGLRPGDVLHFGEQVAVFYEDHGVPGRLDGDDFILQSWRASPHVTAIRTGGFADRPVRLFRWK